MPVVSAKNRSDPTRSFAFIAGLESKLNLNFVVTVELRIRQTTNSVVIVALKLNNLRIKKPPVERRLTSLLL
jgi:hypothetical protein